MQDAMSIGLSGMAAAEASIAARARNLANINTKGYRPVEPVQKSVEGGVQTSTREVPLTPATAAALGEIPAEGERFAEDLVNLKLAETAYKASAAVVRTANRLADEALETLG